MYSLLHNLLADRKGGEIFTLFGAWHFVYIALAAVAVVALLLLLRKKSESTRTKTLKILIFSAFSMYIADFFLMPLAYGEIDIEKLPFHACTASCVACFLSYFLPCLAKYRTSFAMLGLISNLVYLIYPAGVMWHAVHPISYRVIQTLLFHAVMSVYTLLLLSRTGVEPNCPTTMHFRIFRRAFTHKIDILLRKITPKSIKNAFAGGCEQF